MKLTNASNELFEQLTRLCKSWPKGGWSWDGRFSCVASSFGVDLTGEAEHSARQVFPNVWTTQNVRSAPALVCEIARSTGGLRDEQRLFSSAPAGGLMAYGLWWPWGDETTISLRVGLAGSVAESDTTRFRTLFGALD